MSETPKTIQIFLPGGDPRGIRVAEITTRIVQVIEVPRSLLQDFLKMPESGQVALYCLFGDSDGGDDRSVYIGQSSDLRARLLNHHKEKDFWQRAIVLISRTNNLTQTHALFLEWHSLQKAQHAERYVVKNSNGGSKPHTPAPLEADCIEIFETGHALLATLGYPLFDPIAENRVEEQWFCNSGGATGRGLYTEEGFVVLKGSVGRSRNVQSIAGTTDERSRTQLINSGVMRVDGEKVIFEKDHLFNSPSAAAVALLGRTANGWLEWRNKEKRTLNELKRQISE